MNRIESHCIARTAACGISTALMRPKTGCVSINQQLHIFGMLPTERERVGVAMGGGMWHCGSEAVGRTLVALRLN